ncbi:MAG: ABC transporter substrate-binding protein [Pelagimonas sp.]|jgi:branched-chain amino acid transport system substrate-binding protein|nr:ABC transporter substrate-binding protein [Pelagimonas sp.]
MKKLLLATAASALTAGAALADDVKVGVILGFTGPIESLTPGMAASAELAMKEISDSGKLLGGKTMTPVRADSTCVDSAAAGAAAERLITSEGVVAIMGADCSGVTGAILSNVAVPNGVPMISPSATSPALSETEDNGLFFRTAPSDARQGAVLADIVVARGIMELAVTYTNNDYGKGLADSFSAAYTAAGGKITLTAPHDDAKADYSAEVGALASAGGDALAVFGYTDKGGKGIIQASIDTDAFGSFIFGDGMYGDQIVKDLGADLDGTFGTVPWAQGDGAKMFEGIAAAADIDPNGAYVRESYDAAALIALAMAAGGEATSAAVTANVLNVANAPGEKIMPGELGKALEILAAGGEVDYVGATGVELIGPGEAGGTYRHFEVKDMAYETVEIK